ncbi:MAG: type II secretion system F family protein [Emcibacteraceae bacterium]|nr:type II secretion system F family protein [Emcibacteraceae bacterium]
MIVDNPDILMFGAFASVIVIFAAIAFAIGIFGKANKITKIRLEKIKGRHNKEAQMQQQKRALFKKEEKSVLDGLIPKPAELRKRLHKTGKEITFKQYIIANAVIATVITLIIFLLTDLSFLPCITVGVAVGLLLPHMWVNAAINKRLTKFTTQFPEAIDLMVRGLKAGLPVTESISAVSQEMDAPISTEFKTITDEIRFGKTMDEALWQASEKLDTPEFKFFVICISVQQETGGNLGETLGNLSNILRGRAQLKLKINAMSSEGKASAMIIGSLPFIMLGVISSMNFEYMSVMFTDPRGQMALLGGLIWMSIGMFIISKLINFET